MTVSRREMLACCSLGLVGLMCEKSSASSSDKFQDIRKDSWSDSQSALRTLCISQANLSIAWHLERFYSIAKPDFSRVGSQEVEGRHYDVYEASLGGEKRQYWMDVSYWYGRGLDLSPKRDLPMPGSTTPVSELFSGVSRNALPIKDEPLQFIADYDPPWNVRFGTFSSDQLSRTVATTLIVGGQVTILATAVRRYLAEDLPLLHGFRFIAPFIAHQIYHLLAEGRISPLEMKPKADYYVPIPGKDCIDFDWPAESTPANDFWAYMLSNHRPEAFSSEDERNAMLFAMRSADELGLISGRELFDSLSAMRISQSDKVALTGLFD